MFQVLCNQKQVQLTKLTYGQIETVDKINLNRQNSSIFSFSSSGNDLNNKSVFIVTFKFDHTVWSFLIEVISYTFL
jgi:hypothetical protein